jgi:hypothetical protein
MRANMAAKRNLPQEKPQDRQKHPERWEDDLNPQRGAGQTPGSRQPKQRLASEHKRLVRALSDFTVDELEKLPVIEPGSRLKAGATYVDLLDPERKELRAKDGDVAGSRAFYVAKADVARALWNRLRRVRATAPEGNAPTRRATATREPKGAPAARRARPATAARKGLEVRGRSDAGTRHVEQGDNERRGGSERSERRGASAVRSTAATRRH